MDLQTLQTARSGLMKNDLVAWRPPIYQVLCLEPVSDSHRSGSVMSLGDILNRAMEVKND